MRIAQVSPLYESVPPRLYGGTERVVSYLTEALVAQGHDVTLFASGDSVTSAELVPICDSALRLNPRPVEPLAYHTLLLEEVAKRADEFDIIHYHIDYQHFPLSRRSQVPQVTTLHGRLDTPELIPVFRTFPEMPVISISDAQRRPLPWLNWQATIHHGLLRDLYQPRYEAGDYLAFIGRVSPEKRVDRAIDIALALELPLKIAAKVDRIDREYFQTVIEPRLDHPLVEFIGEIGEAQKGAFLGNAMATLFPIDWPEPFGLTMIESLACGTPVIAFNHGSVPEVLDHGKTGFIVTSVEEAVEAVRHVDIISRRACRRAFEQRFTADRMAHDYVRAFEHLSGIPTLKITADLVAREVSAIE